MNTKYLLMLHLRQDLPGIEPTPVSRICLGRDEITDHLPLLDLAQFRRHTCMHTDVGEQAYREE